MSKPVYDPVQHCPNCGGSMFYPKWLFLLPQRKVLQCSCCSFRVHKRLSPVVYDDSIDDPKQVYAGLSQAIKAPALTMLSEELAAARDSIAQAYKDNPENWWAHDHFAWGMSVRNLLRSKGFREDYFQINNLGDIYIPLVEEALNLKS